MLISSARAAVLETLREPGAVFRTTNLNKIEHAREPIAPQRCVSEPIRAPFSSASRFVGADVDTAEAIAARLGLDPKSYRQRLRGSIRWYRKPQRWTFAVDSPEWRDMINVANAMKGPLSGAING